MSFPRYAKYKPSGVEWLGEVPEGWEVVPLKRSFAIVGGSTPKSDEAGYWDGDIRWATPSDLSRIDGLYITDTARCITPAGLSSCASTLVPPGSVVVSTRAPIGTVGIAANEMCTNQGCRSLVPAGDVESRYFARLLSVSTTELNVRGRGSTFLELSGEELGAFRVPVPPLPEQTAIAAFLDRETGKIDALVAEQERLIELLKEKRQAVISHAVTKGLNPKAPMKDSGIEWLGEVPAHWSGAPLKRLTVVLRDGTHLPPSRVEAGVPLLSVRNIVDGKFVLRDDDSMISRESYFELCRALTPRAGDLVLAIVGATLGKSAVIPEGIGDFQIQRSLCVFRLQADRMDTHYLSAAFCSSEFQQQLWNLVGYSAQPGIYLGTLGNIRVPVPPLPEQHAIVAHLDRETSRIDALLTEAQRAIDLLQERRSALISAAVTGQIDVRKLAGKAA